MLERIVYNDTCLHGPTINVLRGHLNRCRPEAIPTTPRTDGPICAKQNFKKKQDCYNQRSHNLQETHCLTCNNENVPSKKSYTRRNAFLLKCCPIVLQGHRKQYSDMVFCGINMFSNRGLSRAARTTKRTSELTLSVSKKRTRLNC